MIISRCILLRMRNVSDKSCRENQNTYFIFNNFFPENRAVYVTMWKNMVRVRQDTDDNIIRRMRFAWWITKATHTHTHSEYVILIAFPRQQRLRERASMLRLYVHCLSSLISISCFPASHNIHFNSYQTRMLRCTCLGITLLFLSLKVFFFYSGSSKLQAFDCLNTSGIRSDFLNNSLQKYVKMYLNRTAYESLGWIKEERN
jgi:hypothetical protein